MEITILIVLGLVSVMIYAISEINPYFAFIWQVIYRGIGGFAILFIFNLLGGLLEFLLPINFFTALYVGFLGLPGIITLALLKGFLS